MAATSRFRNPTQGGLGRRVFHTLLALAGWVLFVWWWWIVFQRVTEKEIRYTAIFVAVALVVIVGLTVIWAVHNAWIYRRRGPRKSIRRTAQDFSRDSVGREVRLAVAHERCQTAPVVVVRILDGAKVYEPRDTGGGPPRPAAPEAAR